MIRYKRVLISQKTVYDEKNHKYKIIKKYKSVPISSSSTKRSKKSSSGSSKSKEDKLKEEILAKDQKYQILKEALVGTKKGTVAYEESIYQLQKRRAELIGGKYTLPSVVLNKDNKGFKELSYSGTVARHRSAKSMNDVLSKTQENLLKKYNYRDKVKEENRQKVLSALNNNEVLVRQNNKTRKANSQEINNLKRSYSSLSSVNNRLLNNYSLLPPSKTNVLSKSNSQNKVEYLLPNGMVIATKEIKKPKVTYVPNSSKIYNEKRKKIDKKPSSSLEDFSKYSTAVLMGKDTSTKYADTLTKYVNTKVGIKLLPEKRFSVSWGEIGELAKSVGSSMLYGPFSRKKVLTSNVSNTAKKFLGNLVYDSVRLPGYTADLVFMVSRLAGKGAKVIDYQLSGNELSRKRLSSDIRNELYNAGMNLIKDPTITLPVVIGLVSGGVRAKSKVELGDLEREKVSSVKRVKVKDLSKDYKTSSGKLLDRGLAEKVLLEKIQKEFESYGSKLNDSLSKKIVKRYVNDFNKVYKNSLSLKVRTKIKSNIVDKLLTSKKKLKSGVSKTKRLLGGDRLSTSRVKKIIQNELKKDYSYIEYPKEPTKLYMRTKTSTHPRVVGVNRLINSIKRDIIEKSPNLSNLEIKRIIKTHVKTFNKFYDRNILRNSISYLEQRFRVYSTKLKRSYRLLSNRLKGLVGLNKLKESELLNMLKDILTYKTKKFKVRSGRPYYAKGKLVGRSFALKEFVNLVKKDLSKEKYFNVSVLRKVLDKRVNEFNKLYDRNLVRVSGERLNKGVTSLSNFAFKKLDLVKYFFKSDKLRYNDVLKTSKFLYLDKLKSNRSLSSVSSDLLKGIKTSEKSTSFVNKIIRKKSDLKVRRLNKLKKLYLGSGKLKSNKSVSNIVDKLLNIEKSSEKFPSEIKELSALLKKMESIDKKRYYIDRTNKKLYSDKPTPTKKYRVSIKDKQGNLVVKYVNSKVFRRYLKINKEYIKLDKNIEDVLNRILNSKRVVNYNRDYDISFPRVKIFKNEDGYVTSVIRRDKALDLTSKSDRKLLRKMYKERLKELKRKNKLPSKDFNLKTRKSVKSPVLDSRVNDKVLLLVDKPETKVRSSVKPKVRSEVMKERVRKLKGKEKIVSTGKVRSRSMLRRLALSSSVVANLFTNTNISNLQSTLNLGSVLRLNNLNGVSNLVNLSPREKMLFKSKTISVSRSSQVQDTGLVPKLFSGVTALSLTKLLRPELTPLYSYESSSGSKLIGGFQTRYGYKGLGNSVHWNKVKSVSYSYMADLYSLLNGIKATSREAKNLLRRGRVFTGLERRKIVR